MREVTRKRTKWALAGAALLVAGLAAGTALGAGLPVSGTGVDPEQGSLWYSGVLTSAAGVPLTGASPNITIKLWSDATATGPTFLKCTAGPVNPTLTSGHFRVALDRNNDDCVRAVHANPQLWVEITVGTDPPMARTPLGAVPYALEAGRVSITGPGGTVTMGGYCGATAPHNGNVGGYVGGRDLCVTACANSPSAHICSGDELVSSAQAGRIIPTGRYASGQASDASASGSYFSGGSAWASDCEGFTLGARTSGSHFSLGAAWSPGVSGGRPDLDYCDTSYPVLCCD
jgi:hypothetical protein